METQAKLCPNCQRELTAAAASGATKCPACGFSLALKAPLSLFGGLAGWWLFFGVLLAPGFLLFLLTSYRALGGEMFSDDVRMGVGFFGSVVAALFCGIWLAVRVSRKSPFGFLLALLFIPAITM